MNNSEPPDDVVIKTVLMHPNMAVELLEEFNTHNRRPRKGKSESFRRLMTKDMWYFNGATIVRAADGTLLDGQNRLQAIADSGKSIWCLMVEGIEPTAQDTMDTGATRTAADVLTLKGEANSSELAAIVRRTLRYERGLRSVASGYLIIAHQEIGGYVETHPEVRQAVHVAQASRRAMLSVSHSTLAANYHICAKINEQDAQRFYMEQLIGGVNLQPEDPGMVLRNRFEYEAKIKGRLMAPEEVFRYTFMAWNLFRKGTKVKKLQGPKGGWSATNFPEPK